MPLNKGFPLGFEYFPHSSLLPRDLKRQPFRMFDLRGKENKLLETSGKNYGCKWYGSALGMEKNLLKLHIFLKLHRFIELERDPVDPFSLICCSIQEIRASAFPIDDCHSNDWRPSANINTTLGHQVIDSIVKGFWLSWSFSSSFCTIYLTVN